MLLIKNKNNLLFNHMKIIFKIIIFKNLKYLYKNSILLFDNFHLLFNIKK